MNNILDLADMVVNLVGQLNLEGGLGDDVEAEQGRTPTPRSNVSDFPQLPVEDIDALAGTDNSDAGREESRAHEAIDAATDILQRLLDDPQLVSALDEDHRDRLNAAVQYISKAMNGGDIPISVKAIIRDSSGAALILRDAYSDYWDIPGGHVQEGESLGKALRREVKEETDLDITKATQTMVKILKLGGETKPVVFFNAEAVGEVKCSEEHVGHKWASDDDVNTLNLGVFKAVLIPTAQERSEYTSSGTEMPAGERGGDGQLFTRSKAGAGAAGTAGHTLIGNDDAGDKLDKNPAAIIGGIARVGARAAAGAAGAAVGEEAADRVLNNKVEESARATGVLQASLDTVGEESEVVNPRLAEMVKELEKILQPNENQNVLETEQDVETDAGQRYESEPKAAGGMQKEGDGGGIMGAGDSMIGEDVHTSTAGGGRRRRSKMLKLIKTKVGKAAEPLGILTKMTGRYHLLNGDSAEVLKSLPSESVHCAVTSPSYWGPKMDLGREALGGEEEIEEYIEKLTEVFNETKRILSKDGSLWIVLGDGAHDNTQLSVPSLLAKALIADGWYLQESKSWNRGRERPDTVLHLTKGISFYSNKGIIGLPESFELSSNGTMDSRSKFAQFPIELSERLIEFSCPPDGVVIDMFVGTGTTLVAARNLGRAGVGVDIDKSELDVAFQRLGLDIVPMTKIQKAVKQASDYDMVVISKASTGNRFIVAGYASPVLVDQEGHRITHAALAKDLPRFMANGGEYANVNIMHSNVTVGKIIPSFKDRQGKVWKTEVNDTGLFVIAEIRTDEAAPGIANQVIDDIESGKLRAFSISGNADNPTFICDGDRCFYDINELELYEITLAVRQATVLTSLGSKEIEDIRPDDLVLTHRHNYRPVTATRKIAYEGELIRLTTDDGKVLELTPEHRVRVKGRGWIYPTDLKEGDELTKETWTTRLPEREYLNQIGGIKTKEGRARQVAGVTSNKFRQKRSEGQKIKWQDPEYRKDMLEKLEKTRQSRVPKVKICTECGAEFSKRYSEYCSTSCGLVAGGRKTSKSKLGVSTIMSPEGRANQIASITTLEHLAKRSAMMKEKWQEEEYVKVQMKARGVSPNKLEVEAGVLLKRFGFDYVGSGDKIIAGKCPDFWNGDNKVIEMYGDYWHKGQNPQDRIDIFKAEGYDCLVIWESEWKNSPTEVAERVAEFSWKESEVVNV